MMGDIQGFKWWTKGTVRALLPAGPMAGITATQEFQKVLAQVSQTVMCVQTKSPRDLVTNVDSDSGDLG